MPLHGVPSPRRSMGRTHSQSNVSHSLSSNNNVNATITTATHPTSSAATANRRSRRVVSSGRFARASIIKSGGAPDQISILRPRVEIWPQQGHRRMAGAVTSRFPKQVLTLTGVGPSTRTCW
jgi:hypothetical protein